MFLLTEAFLRLSPWRIPKTWTALFVRSPSSLSVFLLFLWFNYVLQSTRGKGIFIFIRTRERTKAAIVGSQMGMLSRTRQSCLLSRVFTTLSQPAGIWKPPFFFFFKSLPECIAFHLPVLQNTNGLLFVEGEMKSKSIITTEYLQSFSFLFLFIYYLFVGGAKAT